MFRSPFAWTAHKDRLLPCALGVAAALAAALLLVFLDNQSVESDSRDPGALLLYAVPLVAGAAATLAAVRPSWRTASGCLAHTMVVLYPFLLPNQPWWALGAALAIHLLALLLHAHPVTRLAVAATGWPLLFQVAYREDLGQFNPALAGLLLAAQLLLLWSLLSGPWRAIPQAVLAGILGLVSLLAFYSLVHGVELDRMAAGVVAALAAYAVTTSGRRGRPVSLPSIPWPA